MFVSTLGVNSLDFVSFPRDLGFGILVDFESLKNPTFSMVECEENREENAGFNTTSLSSGLVNKRGCISR